jgi:hypothetical protein
MKRLLLLSLSLFCTLNAYAHKPSDSYLRLGVEGNTIAGQWDIALRDLDFAIGLDSNGDGAINWGEVRAKHSDIAAYAMSRLQLSAEGKACSARVTEHLVDDHTDGAYAVLRFNAECPAIAETLQARYALFFDIDPQHKGLLRLQYQGSSSTGIFSPDKATQQFSLSRPNRLGQFLDYGREGVWHIWIGFDHILFLLALLLPAVVFHQQKEWQAVGAFKPALWAVLKIVTAFTVAHSITLTLATLGVISLPSRWVESIIAASVVFAALNNIFPLFRERRWLMAFVFGRDPRLRFCQRADRSWPATGCIDPGAGRFQSRRRNGAAGDRLCVPADSLCVAAHTALPAYHFSGRLCFDRCVGNDLAGGAGF